MIGKGHSSYKRVAFFVSDERGVRKKCTFVTQLNAMSIV